VIHWLARHWPWVALYVASVAAIGAALGQRLKAVREAQERLAAMQRKHLGL
jgi:hypothetical protein